MDLKLDEKTVLVTGAAGGVGLACVAAFLDEGARVVATDIDPEARAAIAKANGSAATDLDDRVMYHTADLLNVDEINGLVAAAEARFGPVDICVNNAGITHRVDFLDMAVEDFDRVIATNLRAPFLLSQIVARRLVATERHGAIVNVGSVNAQLALPDNVGYVSSKGGLLQLTRATALALADKGIRVNMVAPGSIDTPLQRRGMSRTPALRRRVLSRTPLGRLGRPDEVADTILYMSSERASYVTGECVFVDGGRIPLNFTVAIPEDAGKA